jgi:hypothetical protein
VGESLTLSIQAEAIASLAKTLTILFRGVKQAKEEESQKKEGKRQHESSLTKFGMRLEERKRRGYPPY